MKIGYDAKRAFLNSTGLGNYSRWLLKSLAQYYPQHEYHLYTPKTKPNAYLRLLQSVNRIFIHLPENTWLTSWWRTKGIVTDLQRDQIQLYHGLSHELPLGIAHSGIASVVTVHDVIALRFPEYFNWLNRKIYVAKLKYACRTATAVVAISRQTQQDLVDMLGVDPQKISVIYQNCDAVFAQPVDAAQRQIVKQKYSLPDDYLLTVGTIEKRKNLLLLVKALKATPATVKLIVVGKATPYLQEVTAYLQAEQLSHRVTFLHQVPFDDLPAIYQLARLFVYPSRYEGFGIPILEALNSGIPVIAATGSCLEEAGGPDSLYVNPDDEQDLSEKINLVLTNHELSRQMSSKGKAYAANFADDQLAGQLIQVYQQTLSNYA